MAIREFRDTHQKGMHNLILFAGEYLERNGLLFGKDFTTGEALDLAAAYMTRKMTEDYRDEQEKKFLKLRENRFETEDWSKRFGVSQTEK